MGKRVMMQIQTLLAEIIEGFILEVIVIFNLEVKNHSHKELMKSKKRVDFEGNSICKPEEV